MESSAAVGGDTTVELELRTASMRTGVGLGWLSVDAVLIALVLGLPANHRWIVFALMVVAGLANGSMLIIPERWRNAPDRIDSLLDVWSVGLLALVAAAILLAGPRADLDLLLFLIVPFLATIHVGWRRLAWLTVAIAAPLTLAAVSGGLPVGVVALRAVLLTGAAMLAVALADLNRRAAATRVELQKRAELETVLLAEAHHRIKNSLQTVADLLLLGRPTEAGGRAFDETAERIRAIAAVHRLLAEQRGAYVPAFDLLEIVAHGLVPGAAVTAVDERLDPTTAQQVGMVANELIANAAQHGRPPIEVELRRDAGLSLIVRDHGDGLGDSPPGLGIQLVDRIAEHGLRGSFCLRRTAEGNTEAEVSFAPA